MPKAALTNTGQQDSDPDAKTFTEALYGKPRSFIPGYDVFERMSTRGPQPKLLLTSHHHATTSRPLIYSICDITLAMSLSNRGLIESLSYGKFYSSVFMPEGLCLSPSALTRQG